ncbi:FAD-binding oxidoreductase [Sciscionella marina]|uniref:FAD-binding oxidoreductase n=1 Tax=Sciscionella marina TaxID=508770 RepID=UPI00036797B7|nr:FAD-binding oxidoreductase [Sciscionella marina]
MSSPEFHPYRWGTASLELPEAVRAALAAFGVREPENPPVAVEQAALPDPVLSEPAEAALAAIVGADRVQTGRAARVGHTRGWSTPDLLALRAGDAADAPDAVVSPGTHEQTVAVLETCAAHRIAVVPYSGGTSVVGGLVPARSGFAAVISLDTRALTGLQEFDEISRTARFGAGTRGPEAERSLGERGYTLGHFPQSYEGACLGGYAAARSAGQASAGYGRFDEMVVGLTLATPRGTVTLGTAPKAATGPDLRQLVLGSEGTLGVITSVTVRVRRAPAEQAYEGWRFGSFAEGATALRRLAQDGPLPAVLRLSDEAETAVNLADPAAGPGSGGCLAIIGYADGLESRSAIDEVLREAGGEPLGDGPGQAWEAGRYRAPYLRDALLDAGAFAETLETATFWSNLDTVKAAVTEAITAHLERALVLCHISHVYETGASLYFTVVCAQGTDPAGRWAEAKHAANAAIRTAGAAITHHHGVGTDHRDTYLDEIGPLAADALRGAKRALDPEGIMNPGVLLPADG